MTMDTTLYAVLTDIIFAAIALLIIIGAYRNGFLRTAVLLVGYVVSILAALALSRGLSVWMYDNFFQEPIQSAVTQIVEAGTEGISFETVISQICDSLPKFLVNPLLATFGGEDAVVQSLQESTGGVLVELGDAVSNSVVRPVATELLRVILCLLIFLICVIIVRAIASLFRHLYSVPILGTVNSILGALLGIAKAAVILFLIAVAVSLTISITGNRLEWLNTSIVEKTYLLKPLYHMVV